MNYRNVEWEIKNCGTNTDFRVSASDANLAVLMDIRTELKRLNTLLSCKNFQDIPRILREIKKNSTKKRKTKDKENEK